MRNWYREHLGIDVQEWGGAAFMINYRVRDLAALLKALRKEGCQVLDKTDGSGYGKFGWVMDPEGNKIELWQPPDGQ